MFELKFDAVKFILDKGTPPVKYLLYKEVLNDYDKAEYVMEKELKPFKPRVKLIKNIEKTDFGNSKNADSRKGASRIYKKKIIVDNLKKIIDFSVEKSEEYVKNCFDKLIEKQYETGYIPSPIDTEYVMPNGDKVFLYDPRFCGEVVHIMLKFGYYRDKRVKNAFKWFNNNQRGDGGFLGTWPIKKYVKAKKPDKKTYNMWWKELLLDRKIPSHIVISSHILSAYAYNPEYKRDRKNKKLARFLVKNVSKPDVYREMSKTSWYNLKYDNYKPDVLRVIELGSISGFRPQEIKAEHLLEWIVANQKPNGSWQNDGWVTYKVISVLKNLRLP